MITNFNDYSKLYEKIGYPVAVDQIWNIIVENCYEHYKKYLNRKGKFANYNVTEKIMWNDFKDKIDPKYFKDFPVERINLKFSINILKDSKELGFSSSYKDFEFKGEDKSKMIKSKSDIVDDAMELSIVVGLTIPKNTKSIDINLFTEYIHYSLMHELTHAYQDYKQYLNKSKFVNIFDSFLQLVDKDSLGGSKTLYNFLWTIYKSQITELNADSASILKDGLEIINDIYINLVEFQDYDKMYKQIENEFNGDFEYFSKTFGDSFASIYSDACEYHGVKPNPRFLSLKGKDLKFVMKSFKKHFANVAEYLKKKITKMIYTYGEDEKVE